MRKTCLTIVMLLLCGGVALAGVANTKHNFTSAATSPNAYFTGASQVCAFCHTPHNGASDQAPLFNHQTSLATYDMYTSPTIDMSQTAQPNNGSLVCLSCHDGTIAVNALNNVPGPGELGTYGSPAGADLDASGKLLPSANAYVGTNLQDDHPVGLVYDNTQDPDFVAKTGVSTSYPDKLLYQGTYVECSSCHDPHDNTYGNFLVEDNGGSNLCLRCHTK